MLLLWKLNEYRPPSNPCFDFTLIVFPSWFAIFSFVFNVFNVTRERRLKTNRIHPHDFYFDDFETNWCIITLRCLLLAQNVRYEAQTNLCKNQSHCFIISSRNYSEKAPFPAYDKKHTPSLSSLSQCIKMMRKFENY